MFESQGYVLLGELALHIAYDPLDERHHVVLAERQLQRALVNLAEIQQLVHQQQYLLHIAVHYPVVPLSLRILVRVD